MSPTFLPWSRPLSAGADVCAIHALFLLAVHPDWAAPDFLVVAEYVAGKEQE